MMLRLRTTSCKILKCGMLLCLCVVMFSFTIVYKKTETRSLISRIQDAVEQTLMPREDDNMSQEQRHTMLSKRCDSTRFWRPKKTLDYIIKRPWLLQKLIYDDKHKLIYCYIPKVSCTQWKKMFGILTGTLPNTSLEAIDHEKAHMYYVHRTLSQLSEPEIRRRLETYTSFMFVRHPLERMVSGYRDKLGPNSTHRFRRIHAVEIMGHPKSDKARLNKSETLRSSGHSNNLPTITFDRFAAWVVAAGPFDLNKGEPMEGPQNEHWRPMTDMCHPCTIPYTVLGRTATLAEDARLVLRTANITSVKFPEGYRSATPGVTESLVSTVPSDGLRGVLRHYLQDLFLFGYRPQEVFQNTTARDIVQTMYEELLAEAQHDVGSEDLEAKKVSDK